ncbi:MAG: histidine phosphatase family protein [Anaerolineales bacterium]|nr:histidine phosphatase family protein [Anaerolineales bacterium]
MSETGLVESRIVVRSMSSSPQLPAIYAITLLRHGQSVGNAEGYRQGQSDFPLTETGIAQAHSLAEHWLTESRTFDLVISSPLARARQTAEIITATLELPLEFDPLWMERDNGRLAGLKAEEADQHFPRPDFIHPYQPIGETGESQWELYLRAGRAVQSLLRRPAGNYLVVSHGGILNMVMYAMLGIVPQANFQGARFRFRNAAFTTLTYNPLENTWVLEGVNDREHWNGSVDDCR